MRSSSATAACKVGATTTVSTVSFEPFSASSNVTTTASRPARQSGPCCTWVIHGLSHASAVASEQSWAMLHMSGTIRPTSGSVPAAMSSVSRPEPRVPSGTSSTAQAWREASSAKYAHGLCLTA